MSKVIPTLSAKGFVSTVVDKAERAIAYFCVSQYSQTNLYRGNVVTLPWLVQKYGSDALEIRSQLQSALNNYLNRLFDEAQVEVVAEDDSETISLDTKIVVIDQGVRYDLGYIIRTTNNKVLDIFDINNQGYVGKNPNV